MKIKLSEKLLAAFPQNRIFYDEPVGKHTATGTGGPVSLLIIPISLSELSLAVNELKAFNYKILGSGSSFLISDRGYNGAIIKTTEIKGIDRYGRYLTALAGDKLRDISDKAYEAGLAGMEWAAADNGTLGAAISWNTSYLGVEIKDILFVAEVITKQGVLLTLREEELNLRRGKSDIQQKGYIITRAILRLEKGDRPLIKRNINWNRKLAGEDKAAYQIMNVFSTSNTEVSAETLIYECKLMGFSFGDASVSSVNPNCIINNGNATSTDILTLINEITKIVYKKKGVQLKRNIKLLGKF